MEPNLPPGYRLRRDPDLLLLRRPDGSVVAAFSASGAAEEAVERAAREDATSDAAAEDLTGRPAPSPPRPPG